MALQYQSSSNVLLQACCAVQSLLMPCCMVQLLALLVLDLHHLQVQVLDLPHLQVQVLDLAAHLQVQVPHLAQLLPTAPTRGLRIPALPLLPPSHRTASSPSSPRPSQTRSRAPRDAPARAPA